MSTDDETHKVDRAGWPPGPWDGEPDKVNWTTAAGLPGMVVRNAHGALCGYVGVPPGHPAYDAPYDDVGVRVHGGLTYSSRCFGHICHVPEPGEPDDVYWLGFDCAHAHDYTPGLHYAPYLPAHLKRLPDDEQNVYRDLAYVRAEVESLARQLAR